MKKSLFLMLFAGLFTHSQAQVTFQDAYEQFKREKEDVYENFREEANRKYVEFLRKAWDEHKVMPVVPKPKDEKVPPVIMPDEDLLKPIESTPIKIEDKVIEIPKIEPQPLPVEPIREQPVASEEKVDFVLYGTSMKVRFNKEQTFKLKGCTPDAVAEGWETLAKRDYDNLIRDCLELRIVHRLNDWAYLRMLDKMAQACMGGKTNEAMLLMAYVYCQSGYQMRLGMDGGRLYLLFATKHAIYDKVFFRIDGKDYYVYDAKPECLDVCEASFPKEQPLSLWIPQAMVLADKRSETRILKSDRYPDFSMQVSVNKNLIDFMDEYPTSMVGDNFMTRWAMYANMPLEERLQKDLLPKMSEKLHGLSQKEAVERLLNWVQTGFVYEYDDKVWGGDRAFFAEESLYYPYCDCEDRSILFTRLVRDLLGLKCILVYYPGHLASAVCFTDPVEGDYIDMEGKRFVVCDPTYIGAPIGRTMPGMDNVTAAIILLE
ncbi:MAG: hypothetical protein IJR02_11770 [Bacteroidaceae bacterium]|nr:hypothetical protein [Bacteroidaceae bacterium]